MTADRDAIIKERKLLKKKYGALFDSVAAVLFEVDPIGINFESNTDEYEPEVGTILPRLTQSCTVEDIKKIVHEEFSKWFGIENVGSKEQYSVIATKIFDLWREFNRTGT